MAQATSLPRCRFGDFAFHQFLRMPPPLITDRNRASIVKQTNYNNKIYWMQSFCFKARTLTFDESKKSTSYDF
jgi:hypothetical protein